MTLISYAFVILAPRYSVECVAYSRGTFDRQDSVRSDYMSDRDGRYGIVQQASLESTDSRLCYLTSSEVSYPSTCWPYQPDTSKCHSTVPL